MSRAFEESVHHLKLKKKRVRRMRYNQKGTFKQRQLQLGEIQNQ